jgi:leucyl aminopeptidase (aminopeptidase T)
MEVRWRDMAVGVAVAGLVASSALAQGAAAPGKPVDTEVLARKMVVELAHIKEGENVVILGGVRDIQLLEDIAVQVRKLGAFPLIIHRSERLSRRMFHDVPEKWDSQLPEFNLKLGTIIDAFFEVDFTENPGYLADVPTERMGARWEANELEDQISRRRGVRNVSLGNEMYPTAARARLYRVTLPQLEKMFWEGVNIDYAALQARGAAFRKALEAGKELRITHPNGTDLRIRIEGRPVFVSDGVIDEEDVKRGAAETFLPAGEVYLVPVKGTAEGTLVDDEMVMDIPGLHGEQNVIKGFKAAFKEGKIVSLEARSGLDTFKKVYWDVVGPGRDELSLVNLGINPKVKFIPGSRLEVYQAAGMVTVGIGNQQWAGSDNPARFGSRNYLPGSTVTLDGKVLIQSGELSAP